MKRLEHIFGPRLDASEIRTICGLAIGISLLTAMALIYGAATGQPVLGHQAQPDFSQFLVAGDILNNYAPERLYDLELQSRKLHEIRPSTPADGVLPFAYPPYLAFLLRPVARLPYIAAYSSWLALSAGLFFWGLSSVWPHSQIPPSRWLAGITLAATFPPFFYECWVNGQISVLAFCAFALVVRCVWNGHPLMAGLCLALCLYKPPLLVIVIPLLVVGRQWRILAGFAAGAALLAAISAWATSLATCRSYGRLLAGYITSATGAHSPFRLWKYVDLNTFLQLLPGGRTWPALVVAGCVVLGCVSVLGREWWHYGRRPRPQQLHLWAATITAGLALSVYVPIYDCTLAVIGACLTDRLMPANDRRRRRFAALLALSYSGTWFTQAVASATGVQVYTAILLALAAFQLDLSRNPKEPGAQDWQGGSQNSSVAITDKCR